MWNPNTINNSIKCLKFVLAGREEGFEPGFFCIVVYALKSRVSKTGPYFWHFKILFVNYKSWQYNSNALTFEDHENVGLPSKLLMD